ncbi:acyl-homoserine-lactone synthase [Pseudomonas gessardii]|uniref:Acyl-homoserine-lactone synthase n=1 Tax=Pseudomonas gessardii TaxID=78544 RepID=A0ABS9F2V1_9PSED|nr:acyl-homoserine-lactone synthase [Pseudomonas gessardii]MBH3420909.1 GNAT family N-acetyltransferase [Pseudomonas gessardii]MCF4979670.1 GNAT family N-acetyltransferase [Pseudomonas gessardii]MCF4988640.1 GNAT family N-acetyltransferase [Pseudomonas gessardii]MCF5088264.1 GNAT family N-acetyltransferase [Pseudomonas gessardii]MCF5094714.1 GNAT family N-acetyltransferase [Pseudomonas gessardii]
MHFTIGRRHEIDSEQLCAMHRLRADVFKKRKGWDVAIIADMEIDGYDALEPLYMLIQDVGGSEIKGCWRILPTTGPYMLRDTFSELLEGRPAPVSSQVWELSRFAVTPRYPGNKGFSDFTLEAVKAIVAYGIEQHIQRYVTVTTVAVERMLIRAGLVITRLGPVRAIGKEKAIALEIDLGAVTQRALFGVPKNCCGATLQ